MKNFYRDKGLIISITALIIALLLFMVFVYQKDTKVFWLTAPFVVLVSGFAVGKLIQVTRKTFQYFMHIDEEIDFANKVSLYNFPLSIAIIDSEKRLVWFNTQFYNSFSEYAQYGNSLDSITTTPLDNILEGKEVEITYNGKYYILYASAPREKENNEIYIVYFREVTRLRMLEMEKALSHPVAMLITIDSYEELFGNDLESEKAHVTVQIDKLLEEFFSKTTGILKKTSRDRFWAVIEERHLNEMIENKFHILDKVREITVNDRMSVTLSIGVGKTARTLSESEEFAKQALDMALGRGGDQVAVKVKNGFEFFGGVSKGVERHTKVKARIIANSLMELISESDAVYIMGHRYSDLDSVGACVGLTCAIRNLNKPTFSVIDKHTTMSTQLVEAIEKNEEKPSIFITPQAAKNAFTEKSLLIIVDTHNPEILDDFDLYAMANRVVVIDHHRKMVAHIDNALIFHHEPYASSSCEMVTELLQYFGNAGRIFSWQAEALLAGIMLDTKNFTVKTGVRTFEAAAYLRKLGADTVHVKSMFSGSIDLYREKAGLVANAKLYKHCAIAIAENESENMRVIISQAADELLGISGVDASFVMYKNSSGDISISARSLGAINVQLIMEKMGGGGHQTMAGAQLKNTSLEAAHIEMQNAIDYYYTQIRE